MKRVLLRAAWLALAGGLCLGPLPQARAQQESRSDQYVVQEGDTCLGVLSKLGGRLTLAELHRLNPQLGPDSPHRLVPGAVLKVSEGTMPDAILSFVRPLVQTRAPSSERWQAGRQGEELYRLYRVATEAGASTEVAFPDDSQLILRENSLLIIYGPTSDQARRYSSRAALERGSLRGGLAALRGEADPGLQLKTPAAEVDVRARSLMLEVDPKRTSRVAVYHGSVAVRAQGQSVRVPQGSGTVVVEGRPPAPPRPLPTAPEWLPGLPQEVLALNGTGTHLELEWRSPQTTGEHELEVAGEPTFRDLELITRLPGETQKVALGPLSPGEYFVRVSRRDGDGLQGPTSPPLRLRVWGILLSAGEADPTSGRWTVPGDTEVRLAAPDAQAGLALDGQPPTRDPLQVRAPGIHRIQLFSLGQPVSGAWLELEVLAAPEAPVAAAPVPAESAPAATVPTTPAPAEPPPVEERRLEAWQIGARLGVETPPSIASQAVTAGAVGGARFVAPGVRVLTLGTLEYSGLVAGKRSSFGCQVGDEGDSRLGVLASILHVYPERRGWELSLGGGGQICNLLPGADGRFGLKSPGLHALVQGTRTLGAGRWVVALRAQIAPVGIGSAVEAGVWMGGAVLIGSLGYDFSWSP